MAKQFRIHFKNSDHFALITAHHFELSVNGGEMDFYKDEKQKDEEIYVRLDAVAAITPVEPQAPPRTSTSVTSFPR